MDGAGGGEGGSRNAGEQYKIREPLFSPQGYIWIIKSLDLFHIMEFMKKQNIFL